jgi:hypothetical protein
METRTTTLSTIAPTWGHPNYDGLDRYFQPFSQFSTVSKIFAQIAARAYLATFLVHNGDTEIFPSLTAGQVPKLVAAETKRRGLGHPA